MLRVNIVAFEESRMQSNLGSERYQVIRKEIGEF